MFTSSIWATSLAQILQLPGIIALEFRVTSVKTGDEIRYTAKLPEISKIVLPCLKAERARG